MGSKNSKNKALGWAFAVIALLVVGLLVTSLNVSNTETATSQVTKEVIQASTESDFCANNPSLDAKIRIQDALNTSRGYVSGTVLIENMDTGSIIEHSITGGSVNFTTISNLYDCKSEKGYRLYVKGDGTLNSDGTIDITPEMLQRDPIETTILSSQYASYKVSCYDNVEKGKCKDTTSASTGYAVSLTASFNSSSANFSADVADVIDVTFTLAPNVSNMAKGKGLIIAVDSEDSSNLDDFDESLSTVTFDGVVLEECSKTISANELRALSTYESIFCTKNTIGMNAAGDKITQSKLDLYLEAEAGAASKSFDPVIKIVALGDYTSDDSDQVLTDIGFRDNPARTELYSAQTITLVVDAAGNDN